jgi:hypothetical protein
MAEPAQEVFEIEVFILIDADGDYVVSKGQDDLPEKLTEEIGNAKQPGQRVVCVRLKVPKPIIVYLDGVVPPESPPTDLTVS